jgi:hypothetical protein
VATGDALDNLCALTGTTRLPATKSTLTIGTNPQVLVGTNATPVPSGTVFSVTGTSPAVKFATNASATIATLAAYAAGGPYAVGALVTNAGNIYCCTSPITTATTAPTGTGTAIVDGTGTWRFIAVGSAAVVASCAAQDFGVKAAPAGTLTVIETPVAWPLLGREPARCLDRSRHRDGRGASASGARRLCGPRATPRSMRSAAMCSGSAGVTACTVLQNDTDVTDGNGLPPHSDRVHRPRRNSTLTCGSGILASKAAGTRAYGTNALGTIVDSQGNTQQIDFTRPTTLNIWIIVNGTKDAATYPSDGDAQIKQALVNYSLGLLLDSAGKQVFKGYGAGDTVNAWNLVQAVKTISGVKSISSILIGTANPPTTSNDVATTVRQLALFDTSRISVVLT